VCGAHPSQYDLRLSRYFGTSPGFWLCLQLDFELMRAARQSGELINREVQPHAAGTLIPQWETIKMFQCRT